MLGRFFFTFVLSYSIPLIQIRRTPRPNIASERRTRMTLDYVFCEMAAPIWAPMAAPMEMQIAGVQMM